MNCKQRAYKAKDVSCRHALLAKRVGQLSADFGRERLIVHAIVSGSSFSGIRKLPKRISQIGNVPAKLVLAPSSSEV
jgi:hypothetical protein